MNIIEVLKITIKNKYSTRLKRKDWDFILYTGVNTFWILNANKAYKLTFEDILADDWLVIG